MLHQVYVLWLHLIFVTIIPFTILLCLNRTIHRKLTEGLISMRRTGHEALRRRELRLARVSLGIVLLYMVCHSPKLVPTVCELVVGDAKVGGEAMLAIITTVSLLAHTFPGGNISPSSGHQLQPQLSNIFCGKWQQLKEPSHSQGDSLNIIQLEMQKELFIINVQ